MAPATVVMRAAIERAEERVQRADEIRQIEDLEIRGLVRGLGVLCRDRHAHEELGRPLHDDELLGRGTAEQDPGFEQLRELTGRQSPERSVPTVRAEDQRLGVGTGVERGDH